MYKYARVIAKLYRPALLNSQARALAGGLICSREKSGNQKIEAPE